MSNNVDAQIKAFHHYQVMRTGFEDMVRRDSLIFSVEPSKLFIGVFQFTPELLVSLKRITRAL